MFNANKLSYLRKKEKMSQEQLANKLNISPSTVGMYETAKRQPDNEMVTKIANLFNVSTDYLLDNDLNDVNVSEDNKKLVQSLVDGLTNPLNKALYSKASELKNDRDKADEHSIKLIMGHRINDLTKRVYTHKLIEDLITEINKI